MHRLGKNTDYRWNFSPTLALVGRASRLAPADAKSQAWKTMSWYNLDVPYTHFNCSRGNKLQAQEVHNRMAFPPPRQTCGSLHMCIHSTFLPMVHYFQQNLMLKQVGIAIAVSFVLHGVTSTGLHSKRNTQTHTDTHTPYLIQSSKKWKQRWIYAGYWL